MGEALSLQKKDNHKYRHPMKNTEQPNGTTKQRRPRFDREWTELIRLMPENRREIMERSIREYQLNGSEPEGLDGTEQMAFRLIKKIIDRRTRQRIARQRRANAKRHTADALPEATALEPTDTETATAKPTDKSPTKSARCPRTAETTSSIRRYTSVSDILSGRNNRRATRISESKETENIPPAPGLRTPIARRFGH